MYGAAVGVREQVQLLARLLFLYHHRLQSSHVDDFTLVATTYLKINISSLVIFTPSYRTLSGNMSSI